MVVRAQLTVPFDRDAFEEAVDLAHGFRIVRGSQLHSKIMQSYRKVIWNRKVAGAFPSKCEIEKQRTGRKRPKRERKK